MQTSQRRQHLYENVKPCSFVCLFVVVFCCCCFLGFFVLFFVLFFLWFFVRFFLCFFFFFFFLAVFFFFFFFQEKNIRTHFNVCCYRYNYINLVLRPVSSGYNFLFDA